MKFFYFPPPSASDIVGIVGLAQGGTGADLSGTGGVNQVVQQATAGGVFTVGQLNQSQIASGAVSATTINATRQTLVDGSADEIQLRVQAHSTQTANIAEWQNSSGTAQIVIDPNYRFGLGTASPQTTLHVFASNVAYSALPTTVNVLISTSDAQGINRGGTLGLGGYIDDAAATQRLFGVIVGRKETGGTGVQSGYLAFATNNSGPMTERMRITSGGLIGFGTASPTSTAHINGSVGATYVAKTGTYTITASDFTIDCTSGTFTVTLPTAVGIKDRVYVIKNSGAGLITLATTSSQTIDGLTTQPIAAGAVMWVQSNNANWIII